MKKLGSHKVMIFCIFFLFVFLVMLGGIFLYFQRLERLEAEKLLDIQSHYSSYVSLRENASFYEWQEGSYQKIGKSSSIVSFPLSNMVIECADQEYFLIEGSSYYVYYKDVMPTFSYLPKTIPHYYVPFNEQIEQEFLAFYQDGQKKFELTSSFSLPILYQDDQYYYVSYFQDIYGVLKEGITLKSQEEKSVAADYVSVFHFANLKKECQSVSCMNSQILKEFLNVFAEEKVYSIDSSVYLAWLKQEIRLKPGAVLLLTDRENELAIMEAKNYQFQMIADFSFSFIDSNESMKIEGNRQKMNRYVLNERVTKDEVKKMIAGEKVALKQDPIVSNRGLPSMDAKATSIAVLNYHFFYDAERNERCNESNCLDIRKFREQLSYLKQHHYKTLTMEEYRAWMYREIELPARSVLITIDDGAMGTGKHNGNKLIPILEEFDMHATLFLISGWWAMENYESDHLDIESHTYDMHKEGVCRGVSRGAQMLCSTKDQVLEDLRKSVELLGSKTAFCFPFYAYNDLTIELLKDIGFQLAFIGGSQKSNQNHSKYKIPRYPIHKSITMEQFQNMIH